MDENKESQKKSYKIFLWLEKSPMALLNLYTLRLQGTHSRATHNLNVLAESVREWQTNFNSIITDK